MEKKNLNMKKQWAKCITVLVLYLLFLLWVKSWLGLIVVPGGSGGRRPSRRCASSCRGLTP